MTERRDHSDATAYWMEAHNTSLDNIELDIKKRIENLEERNKRRIKELEDELNGYKLKKLAAQSEPSTWYDDSLKRRVKACEDKLEVRDRLVLSLRGRIADLERENAKLLRELDEKEEG